MMSTLLSAAVRFVREEDAPTMLEYGLLLVSIVIVVAGTCHLFSEFCVDVFLEASTVASSH